MGQVTFDLNANEDKAVRAILEVVRANDQAESSFKKVKKAAEDHSTAAEASGQKAVQAVGGWVAGLTSLAAGVAAVKAEIEDYTRRMQESAEAAKGFLEESQRIVAGAGTAGQAPAMREWMQTVQAQNGLVTRNDVAAIYDTVANAAPQMDLAKQKEIVEEAAKQRAALGGDLKDTQLLAQVMSRLQALNPERSTQDLADMALTAIEGSGEAAKDLGNKQAFKGMQQLQQAGLSDDQALALAIGYMRTGQRATNVSTLADVLTQTKDIPTRDAFQSGLTRDADAFRMKQQQEALDLQAAREKFQSGSWNMSPVERERAQLDIQERERRMAEEQRSFEENRRKAVADQTREAAWQRADAAGRLAILEANPEERARRLGTNEAEFNLMMRGRAGIEQELATNREGDLAEQRRRQAMADPEYAKATRLLELQNEKEVARQGREQRAIDQEIRRHEFEVGLEQTEAGPLTKRGARFLYNAKEWMNDDKGQAAASRTGPEAYGYFGQRMERAAEKQEKAAEATQAAMDQNYAVDGGRLR